MREKTLRHKKLSVILPTLNERENITEMYNRLQKVLRQLEIDYEIIFVDDNSPDGTLNVIRELRQSDKRVKYLLMSRRFGDQIAIMAGIDVATGDMVVVMDADLQHPPEYIPQMVEQWQHGAEIVIMKRKEAGHTSFFKKWSEIFFYKFLEKISNTPIHYRFSGFVLLDRKVAGALRQFQEREPFVRGLIASVGFRTVELYYQEEQRIAGTSKYHLYDMVKLALTGILSFSEFPLYISFYLGMFAISISLLYAIWIFYEAFFQNSSVQGWPSTVLMIIFIGGLQLFSIGLLGIYMSKIFLESKKRPRYIVAQTEGFEGGDETERV